MKVPDIIVSDRQMRVPEIIEVSDKQINLKLFIKNKKREKKLKPFQLFLPILRKVDKTRLLDLYV